MPYSRWFIVRQNVATERHRDANGSPCLSSLDKALIRVSPQLVKSGVTLPSGRRLTSEPIELTPGDFDANCELVLTHLTR